MAVFSGGRFEARGQTLANLARVAYGFEHVDPGQGVVDVPAGWPINDRFDITATADHEWTRPPAGMTVPAELRPMLQRLLEDRFALKAQIRTQRISVTALVLAAKTSALGPGLRPSANDCLGPYTEPQPGATSKPRCPFTLEESRIEAGSVTMPEVAAIIARIQGLRRDNHFVVDRTGIAGTFDLTLSMAAPVEPTSLLDLSAIGERRSRRDLAIREALAMQLGLRLENAKLPVPTLVVERAKRPIED